MNSFTSSMRTRRSILKAGSSLIALPFIEALATTEELKQKPPKRLVFMGGGFGVTEETFFPTQEGSFKKVGIPEGLVNLKPHIHELTMVQGLFNPKISDPHSGSSGYLAGSKTAISCDQLAGQQFSKLSRYPSLVVSSTGDGGGTGHGRGGLSLSNGLGGKPIAGIKTPIALFHALFGNSDQSPAKLNKILAQKRSILDAVSQNGINMKKRLSTTDKNRVEEYFESIRNIEKNLQRQAEWATEPKPKAPFEAPTGGLTGEQEIQAILDMFLVALQTDSARVASYRLPINSLLKSLEITITAHAMSHYRFSKSKKLESQKRDARLMKFYSDFITRLKETDDRSGLKLYDTTITSFGGNLRTGHTLHNCPALIIGGSNKFKKGHNVMLPERTPMTNYWLTVLQDAGIPITQFNDSTGHVSQMLA